MAIFDYPEHLLKQHRLTPPGRVVPPPAYIGIGPRGPFSRLADALATSEVQRSEIAARLFGASIELNLTRNGVRQIITGRRIWVTGTDNSLKAGYPIQYEGSNEPFFIVHSDVDIGVLDMKSQPATFRVFIDGEKKSYTPDYMRLVRPGQVEVIEVKSNQKSISGDRELLAKLDAVSSVCAELGWHFRVIYGEDLKSSNIFNYNVFAISNLRMTTIPPGVAANVERIIAAQKGTASLGQVIDAAGGPIVGRAVTCALLCRSCLHFDLKHPLTNDTAVRSANGQRNV